MSNLFSYVVLFSPHLKISSCATRNHHLSLKRESLPGPKASKQSRERKNVCLSLNGNLICFSQEMGPRKGVRET